MAKISKDSAKALVASEINLRDTTTGLGRVASSPDLKPSEVQQLKDASRTILQLRLRREYPILGRVFEMLSSRLKDGTAVKPLATEEVRGLLELIGQFSHAENDMLKDLNGLGVIKDADFNALVVPWRDQSNLEQSQEFHKAPWAAALVANNVTGMAMTFGALTLLGPLGWGIGAAGATAISLGWGYGAAPRVQAAITDAMRARQDGAGMNALKSMEVGSESILLTNRAAAGSILNKDETGSTLTQRLDAEVAMMNLLLDARSQSDDAPGPLDKMFSQAAKKYDIGLSELAAQNQTVPMSDAQLRTKILAVRADALPPAFLDQAAREVLVNSVVVDSKSQRLAFLRVMGDQVGPQMVKQLADAKGVVSPELQSTAQSMLFWGTNFDTKNVPEFSDELKATLTAMADGKKLDPQQLATMRDSVGEIAQSRKDNEQWLTLDDQDAEDQGKMVMNTLWGQVVPNFEKLDKVPEIRSVQANRQDDGSYIVTGAFKSGVLFGTEGSFSIKLSDLGAPDASSLKVDIGEKYVKAAAESGVKQQLAFLSDQGELSNLQIDRTGSPPDKAYALSGDIGGYSKYSRFQIQVSPMGMIDSSSIKLS